MGIFPSKRRGSFYAETREKDSVVRELLLGVQRLEILREAHEVLPCLQQRPKAPRRGDPAEHQVCRCVVYRCLRHGIRAGCHQEHQDGRWHQRFRGAHEGVLFEIEAAPARGGRMNCDA